MVLTLTHFLSLAYLVILLVRLVPMPLIVQVVIMGSSCLTGFATLAVLLYLCVITSTMGYVNLVSHNAFHVLTLLLNARLALILTICST